MKPDAGNIIIQYKQINMIFIILYCLEMKPRVRIYVYSINMNLIFLTYNSPEESTGTSFSFYIKEEQHNHVSSGRPPCYTKAVCILKIIAKWAKAVVS